MQLSQEHHGIYLYITASGKLDASWADYFTDTLLNYVRNGQHHLVIDASELVFLSSAGIRALLRINKELASVKGSFRIYQATDFVRQTLSTSGFKLWLADSLPADFHKTAICDENEHLQRYILNEDAALTLTIHEGWRPWQQLKDESVRRFSFPENVFALGIGSAAENLAMGKEQFGEFIAVSGNVVFQAPLEESRPDYLIAEKDFIPAMQCIQTLWGEGDMSELLRFAPNEDRPFYPVTRLLEMILESGACESAGFVILGEIEGLVGASLIKSPGLLKSDHPLAFPELKEWLSFSGERVFAHQQGLLAGVVKNGKSKMLPALPSNPDLSAHVHAAVFPYQPLQNDKIHLESTVGKLFNGPPPLSVMHLADDTRPAVGLGESALIRGAVWYAPIQNPEVIS